MSSASPTAFLLWAILSVLFLFFLIYHLWSYDRFQCLRWSAGRQPGAFRRVMTYSYLGSVPLLVVYSVATTVIKYREGFVVTDPPDMRIMPRPVGAYTEPSRKWVIPLNFLFSFAWAFELVTHLEELAFWLYMLHQKSDKGDWFESWEYRLWYCGSIVAILGMPLTAVIARRNIETIDAYIFLSGSCGALSTTIAFLYVLWRFPGLIQHVKNEGADPTVVVRLATFYQLNLARVVFRFMFTVPLLILALDGIIGTTHPLNSHLFSSDFLQMIGGIGCFVSSAITLLIFFPRSITKEAGYKPKPLSTLPNSPKSAPISPPSISAPLSPAPSNFHRHAGSPSSWDGESALVSLQDESVVDIDGIHQLQYAGVFQDEDEGEEEGQVPPYPHPHDGPGPHTQTQSQMQLHHRQPFPHSLSSPQIVTLSPLGSPTPVRVAIPPPARHPKDPIWTSQMSVGNDEGLQTQQQQFRQRRLHHMARSASLSVRPPSLYVPEQQQRQRRQNRASLPVPRLHPYMLTFTSPIDLADISTPRELP